MLVLGAAGGVDAVAVQIAKVMSMKQMITVVCRANAAEYVSSLGADVVVPLTDDLGAVGAGIYLWPWCGNCRRSRCGAAFDEAIQVLTTDGNLLTIGFAVGVPLSFGLIGCCYATSA